jgi:hypothetical protein
VIATNEAVDVLRHGWQDAASTLAADVPEVAELLQARLEMAISTERLDERNLLETIQEVESVTSRAGSPSSLTLARRLRRTVYEYLLALDATPASNTGRTSVDLPAPAADSPMVGAEEVAALGHASTARAGDPADVQDAAGDEAAQPVDADATGSPSSRRRFALRRKPRPGTDAAAGDTADDAVDAELVPGGPQELAAAGRHYTPAGDPAVFQGDSDAPAPTADADGASHAGTAAEPSVETAAAPGDDPDEVAPTLETTDSEPPAGDPAGGEAEPVALADAAPEDGVASAAPGFVAPRAGFHIVEDAPIHRATGQDEARLEMPRFTADEPAPSQPEATAAETGGEDQAGSQFVAWPPAGLAEGAAAEPAPLQPATETAAEAEPSADRNGVPAQPSPASAQPLPASAHPVAAESQTAPLFDGASTHAPSALPEDDDDDEPRGWGVRRPGEARSRGRGGQAVTPPVEDDPFENNSRLSDIRRRIEERLRKKRCDEAAALLQELAQEAGGRAVAELAMNAGDRCRALGKSNAALNCYLAAARSDPVFELPLSRLADICIDNQDTELAVSYLERIARLYRYRGDDKAAIRMYRRIATVAPYRDDVLALLMNAQHTGRLE